MHRTQISLEDQQYQELIKESNRLGISLAALIRRLVAEHLQRKHSQDDPLAGLTGLGKGTGEAVGRHHNRFLYGKSD